MLRHHQTSPCPWLEWYRHHQKGRFCIWMDQSWCCRCGRRLSLVDRGCIVPSCIRWNRRWVPWWCLLSEGFSVLHRSCCRRSGNAGYRSGGFRKAAPAALIHLADRMLRWRCGCFLLPGVAFPRSFLASGHGGQCRSSLKSAGDGLVVWAGNYWNSKRFRKNPNQLWKLQLCYSSQTQFY